MAILRVGLLVWEVNAKPLSHVGDGAAEAMLAVMRCGCRVMLAKVLLRRLGHDAMSVLSLAGDSTIEATWSWHDVGAESCWR
jgi:hypothetical protein